MRARALRAESDGRYDAQALVDNASLGSPFTVSFDWLGPGTPGSQAFEIYDPSFATIESGETVSMNAPLESLVSVTLSSFDW